MRLRHLLLLLASFLLVSACDASFPAPDEDVTRFDDFDCLTHFGSVRNPARFADYPASPLLPLGTAAPILDTPDKRMYRTMIRRAAQSGAPFAGHYRIGIWGAGTSTLQLVIVNTRTGAVTFPPNLHVLTHIYVHDETWTKREEGFDHFALGFTATSRLLIALGAPNEDIEKDGAHFFEWTGRDLREIRFIPRLQACKPNDPN